MGYRDLREWIVAVRELGELRDVRGATWQEDIGRVTEMLHHTDDSPAVLFDDIPGYAHGQRSLVNANARRRRLALTLGLPLNIERRPLMDEFLRLTEEGRALPPRVVKDGPVFENVLKGDAVDVLRFPAPKWHPLDGGRYLGTGVVDVLKDPDSDWANLGTYRVMVHDARRVGVYISPGKHGRQFRDAYFKRREPCPIAVVCGVDPSPGPTRSGRSTSSTARGRGRSTQQSIPTRRGSTRACSSTRRSRGSGASASPSPSAPTPKPSARQGNGGAGS